MALSNILREPRREITESLVGIVIIGALLGGDYYLARWEEHLGGYYSDGSAWGPWGVWMFMNIPIVMILGAMVVFTHFIGDVACDAMEKRGVDLRPRQRPTSR